MTEQQAEQSGHETGSLGAGSADPSSFGPPSDRLTASEQAARNVDSPNIVPDQNEAAKADDKADDKAFEQKAETPQAGMPKAEPFAVQGSKVQGFKVEGFKADAPNPETANQDTAKPDLAKPDLAKPDAASTNAVKAGARPMPRELITSPGEHSWTRSEDQVESDHSAPKPDMNVRTRGRRFAAMAAMLLLAVIAGAAGGALATIRLSHLAETTTPPDVATLEASVGRIDADIMALKEGLERTTNAGLSHFNKTTDRLERIEKAQAEPNAKLARLSDAVDKLRTAAAAATAPAATATAKDVTGTVTAPAGAQAPAMSPSQSHASPAVTAAGTAPTTDVGRLPTIEGWVLRDAGRGAAVIEGRSGLYEVVVGDPVPGLGRVDAIRKQDGRWVVVTTKGLIVAR